MEKKRYEKLDMIRSLALINMIAYHALWDIVYMHNINLQWYKSDLGYIWQQGICWTFIFLSGFCLPLGKHTVKRGITVFMGGVVITAVTLILMPQNRVVFGVLTLISSCMLITAVLDKYFKKLSPVIGLLSNMVIFFFTKNVNMGYIGFEKFNILKLPDILYANILTTYIGFPYKGFYSTDYFSIIPWIFLFMSGYFAYGCADRMGMMNVMQKGICKPAQWLGRHSFEVYMLHQPLIYAALELIF